MITTNSLIVSFTQRHGKSGETESLCSFNKRRVVGRGGDRPISCLLGPVYQFSRISEPRNNPALYCSVVLSINDFEDVLYVSLDL